jgi:glycosyltransferase involved in cell wall biosynthesis
MVDRYFTLTEFSRRKFIDGGLSARQVAVKPNFIHPDPGPGNGQGGYAVFIGRLSPEKGIKCLLSAWTQLAGRLPLKIVGDGPLGANVRAAANQTAGIEWLGRRQPQEVLALLGAAACLVMPSIWYETFGRTIIEAYAKGTPVVASRLGAMAELVHDGRTGVLFEPGNPEDLASKIRALFDDPARLIRMRHAARREYEEKYTAETNYEMLMAIYAEAKAANGREATRSKDEARPRKI